MDWKQVLIDNSSTIIAIFGTLGGVALGYWGQSRRDAKQRAWLLDDQRREWQREKLINLSSRIDRLILRISEIASRKDSNFPLSEVEVVELNREMLESGSLIESQIVDQELNTLVTQDLVESLRGLVVSGGIDEMDYVHLIIQKRINYLIEQTYNPNYD